MVPGGRGRGGVGEGRNLRAHAPRGLHRRDPLDALGERHRMPARPGPHVDQSLAWPQVWLDHAKEVVEPLARDPRVRASPAVPVAGTLPVGRFVTSLVDRIPPALCPIYSRALARHPPPPLPPKVTC